ncbi:MAG: P-loop NTPase fold protein [Flavobacterium sp. JAD_PAG50586_2]|nr:MAG: P-loop NTPase fold protein [Flavobacterium sp. JAD_PAG50586_2]
MDYPFNKNPKSFDDLTPTIIKDEVTYTSALFWALKNKNIKNVALTGSYGSGKSSIIKTFKNRYKEFDYLNISLATFEELNDKEQDEVKNVAKKTKEEKEEREILNQKIELSILQQMLYIERSNKLPNSRFKRIKNFKRHNVILNTAFAFITVLGYVFLFQRELILKICLTHNFFIINADILEIISGIFMLIGIFYLVKSFVKAFSDFKFSKINLKGDVELNREVNDNSILNKNLDEIIYFFERTNYNVVFIEDLDRFKEPEIFTKLREINLLINLSKQVNRHIVFVYALKDEMFVDGNRTKFFDFIIPIIPVINSSNSFEFLYEKLKENAIDENLLDDISLYIDDMRLLKNIVNEYKIYFEKLTKETNINLTPDKLISFVVYKNLYPEDFAKLHKNEGMVYKLFNSDTKPLKERFIEKQSAEIIEIKKIFPK